MKKHFCPSCRQPYGCPLDETNCGSPYVYDCHCCYLARHRREVRALLEKLDERFGFEDCTGHGDFCYAH